VRPVPRGPSCPRRAGGRPEAARRAGLEFVEKVLTTKPASTDTTERNAGMLGVPLVASLVGYRLELRIALGDQAGPPPAGDRTDASAQGPLADGRSAQPLPQPGNGPRLRLGEQPARVLA
jgi:hypothetical protein